MLDFELNVLRIKLLFGFKGNRHIIGSYYIKS